MNNNKGFSLLEVMIAIGLSGFLATIGYNLYQFSTKETTALSEDMMVTIARFGASKIITRDLSGAEPSFNYVNVNDDDGLPFFSLAKNEYCRQAKCSRKLTMEIKKGQTRSKSIYLIVKKSLGKEIQRLSIHPRSVFKPNKTFGGLNWQYASDQYSISKSNLPESPWVEKRIMMLTSEVEFYDCNQSILKANYTGTCNITCSISGTCEYAIKRPFKMLGVVNKSPAEDMTYYPVNSNDGLLQTKYRICRPDKNFQCIGQVDISNGIKSTKTFYERLPYIPGTDDRTILSPVEIVEYFLEKPSANAPDHQITLKRAKASFTGSAIKFDAPLTLMSGIQSIVFSRANISNPVIEYKLRKVRMKKSLK